MYSTVDTILFLVFCFFFHLNDMHRCFTCHNVKISLIITELLQFQLRQSMRLFNPPRRRANRKRGK